MALLPHTTLPAILIAPPQRMGTNKQAIESLAHRVKALAGSLCTPVSEGDTREASRRQDWNSKPKPPMLRTESDKQGILGNWQLPVKILPFWQNKGVL